MARRMWVIEKSANMGKTWTCDPDEAYFKRSKAQDALRELKRTKGSVLGISYRMQKYVPEGK